MARKSRRIKRKASTSRRKSGNLRLLFFILAVVLGIILLAKMFNPTGKISQSGSDVLSSASLVEQSIWQYQTSGTWKYVEGSGTRIAVGPDGNPWVVNSRNEIWKRVNDAWQIVNGEASDISVGANGAVWIVGKNGEISKLNSDGSWEKVDGAATTIAVGPNGQPWVVNSAGQIWRRGVNGIWQHVEGAAKDIAIDARGTAWVIGINGDIWRWNGQSWQLIDGNGTRIAVEPEGNPWVVNSGGQIWRYAVGKWQLIPGSASDIGIGGNGVWVLGNATSPTSTPTVTPTKTPTPPPPLKRVFITSTGYKGNLGGLTGADRICQNHASNVRLGGVWKAWLSDLNTSASARLNHSAGPYKLLNGTIVANNWNDLTDGTIQNDIVITELNTTKLKEGVWTATDLNGELFTRVVYGKTYLGYTCENWTTDASNKSGDGGNSSLRQASYLGPGSTWTTRFGTSCDNPFALYCFEQ